MVDNASYDDGLLAEMSTKAFKKPQQIRSTQSIVR
jgi:hypothetical protein